MTRQSKTSPKQMTEVKYAKTDRKYVDPRSSHLRDARRAFNRADRRATKLSVRNWS